ncbi:MAG: HAMP domain-containing protein [Deltaproteobacteria bacterium]|nr:HAMP domain-containing protein [Deltaproteobacteria bacterium]
MSALVASAPVVVLGVALVEIDARALRDAYREIELAIVGDVARTIDTEIGATEDTLSAIASTLGDREASQDDRLRIVTTLVAGARRLDHVAVFDRSGALVDVIRTSGASGAPEGRIDVPRPPERLPEAVRLAADGESGLGVGEAVTDGRRAPRLLVVVPVRRHPATDRIGSTGYVGSMLSLDAVQARVERLAEAHLGDPSSALFVVDSELRTLAHTDPERSAVLASARDEGMLRGFGGRLPRERVIAASEAVGRDGEPVLGSLVTLDSRPWAVVASVPTRVAYASLGRVRLAVLAGVVGSIVLAVLAAWLVSRRLTAPVRALAVLAKDIAERRFDARADVRSRDELGQLADALHDAAGDLAASERRIREEAAIRQDLGRYLPAPLVEKVVAREQDMGLGGRRCTITVLFADVVAFTPLAEKLEPERAVAILNELFTLLTEVVFRHGGMVDKFVGDCVMAVWGAPEECDDHAERALLAAEDMLRWLETANATWESRFGVSLQLAIGVSSGAAVVGNVGSESRMEYTAIGDVVNVAARLESIARPQQILVTEATKVAAGDRFTFVDLGLRALAGRVEPVHLFEVEP